MSQVHSTRRPALTARSIATHTDPDTYIWFQHPLGLGHYLTANGARYFALRYQWQGRQKIKKLAGGDVALDAVRQMAIQKLADVAVGRDPFPPASATLLAIAEAHVCFLEKHGNRRTKTPLSSRKANSLRKRYARWLAVRTFGRNSPDELNSRKVAAWLGAIRTECGPVSANQARAYILAALRLNGHTTTAFEAREARANEAKAGSRVLSNEEMVRLQSALESAPIRWRVFYSVLQRTGLRPQELATARRDDCDIDAGTLFVRADRRDKSGTGITVALDDRCVELLQELWSKFPPFGGWCFPSLKKRGAPVYNIYEGWEWIRSKAKLPDVVPRDLRRTFGTLAALEGLSAEQISAALGNTSNIAARHYIKLANNPRVIRRVQQSVAGSIDAAVKSRS